MKNLSISGFLRWCNFVGCKNRLRGERRPKLPGSRITARTNSDLSTWMRLAAVTVPRQQPQPSMETSTEHLRVPSESTSWRWPTRLVPSWHWCGKPVLVACLWLLQWRRIRRTSGAKAEQDYVDRRKLVNLAFILSSCAEISLCPEIQTKPVLSLSIFTSTE